MVSAGGLCLAEVELTFQVLHQLIKNRLKFWRGLLRADPISRVIQFVGSRPEREEVLVVNRSSRGIVGGCVELEEDQVIARDESNIEAENWLSLRPVMTPRDPFCQTWRKTLGPLEGASLVALLKS